MRGGKSTAKGRTMNRAIAKATKSTGSSRWARVAFQARRERQNLLARRADTWPSSSRAPRAEGGSADAPSAGTGRRGPSHSGSLRPVVLRPLPPPTREPRAALSAGMTARCTRTLRNVLDSEASGDAGGKNGGARRILISWWQQEGPGSPFPGCSEAHDVRANPKQKEQQAADAPRGPLTNRSMAPPAPPPCPASPGPPDGEGSRIPSSGEGPRVPSSIGRPLSPRGSAGQGSPPSRGLGAQREGREAEWSPASPLPGCLANSLSDVLGRHGNLQLAGSTAWSGRPRTTARARVRRTPWAQRPAVPVAVPGSSF